MNDTQRKVLLRYEQTSLNSARTVKTGPGRLKKLLKAYKCTLFITYGFKQYFFIQKDITKKCMKVCIEAIIVYATLAHRIMSAID